MVLELYKFDKIAVDVFLEVVGKKRLTQSRCVMQKHNLFRLV